VTFELQHCGNVSRARRLWVGGTASCSRASVNHMGGNPTIPRRTIAWRKRAFGAPGTSAGHQWRSVGR